MLKLRVIELLEERGLSRYSLYKQLGMSYQNYSNMINNKTASIRYENIEAMCIFFDITPNELFEWDFESHDIWRYQQIQSRNIVYDTYLINSSIYGNMVTAAAKSSKILYWSDKDDKKQDQGTSERARHS